MNPHPAVNRREVMLFYRSGIYRLRIEYARFGRAPLEEVLTLEQMDEVTRSWRSMNVVPIEAVREILHDILITPTPKAIADIQSKLPAKRVQVMRRGQPDDKH